MIGPAPLAARKEEKFPHTREPLHWQRRGGGGGRGEASEPRRRAQPQGCGGQSGEIPARRMGAEQHSPARESCLLTRRGGRGLGAEARASEGGSQGEDWGWRREHSLKGASASQLAGRESGKKSGPAGEARDLCFGVREERGFLPNVTQKAEHCLRELQRRAQAVAISSEPRDGREKLRLLSLSPRILCASAGSTPAPPPGACAAHHCQGPKIQGQLPWKNTRGT